MRGLFLLSYLIIGSSGIGLAQGPVGRFLSDTIQVGRPFEYALSFRHSTRQEVFFPDTSSSFAPFQVVGMRVFPTFTDTRGSLDSAVYQLLSFELLSKQSLKVPLWVLTKRDCTAIYTNTDTIYLQKTLTSPQQATLQTDLEIVPLRSQINYPMILLGLILLILLAAGIYMIFGQTIQQQLALFQLFRRHREFRRSLSRLTRDDSEKNQIDRFEKALILWKTYLQRLERKPFATYTTKEIIDNLPAEGLPEALRQIDSVVYGGQASGSLTESLGILKEVAERVYLKQRAAFIELARQSQG